MSSFETPTTSSISFMSSKSKNECRSNSALPCSNLKERENDEFKKDKLSVVANQLDRPIDWEQFKEEELNKYDNAFPANIIPKAKKSTSPADNFPEFYNILKASDLLGIADDGESNFRMQEVLRSHYS